VLFGVRVGGSSTVEGLSLSANSAPGLTVGDGSQVLNSLVVSQGDGIRVGGNTTVLGNTTLGASANQGSGILVSGTGSRIEGNVVSDHAIGIEIDGTGNVIDKNLAHGNSSTNYQIAAGNDFGPIGSTATSTSPWANIAY
jgi:parallel beta-helix repeat protein